MRLYIFHRLWMFFILRYTQQSLGVLLNPEWVRRSAAGARTPSRAAPDPLAGDGGRLQRFRPGVLARCLGPVSWPGVLASLSEVRRLRPGAAVVPAAPSPHLITVCGRLEKGLNALSCPRVAPSGNDL